MSAKHEIQIQTLEKRVTALENLLARHLESKSPPASDERYKAVHKGFGYYSVVDGAGNVIADKLRGAEADKKLIELNA